jgi:hypothetical protein
MKMENEKFYLDFKNAILEKRGDMELIINELKIKKEQEGEGSLSSEGNLSRKERKYSGYGNNKHSLLAKSLYSHPILENDSENYSQSADDSIVFEQDVNELSNSKFQSKSKFASQNEVEVKVYPRSDNELENVTDRNSEEKINASFVNYFNSVSMMGHKKFKKDLVAKPSKQNPLTDWPKSKEHHSQESGLVESVPEERRSNTKRSRAPPYNSRKLNLKSSFMISAKSDSGVDNKEKEDVSDSFNSINFGKQEYYKEDALGRSSLKKNPKKIVIDEKSDLNSNNKSKLSVPANPNSQRKKRQITLPFDLSKVGG